MRRGSGALVCGLGAGLAGYSVLVKLAAVPCFSATCGAVINSGFGLFFGIPVGLFGLLLWGALPWLPRAGEWAVKTVLVLGSVAFLYIQAFVLRQFCPICLLHAAACFLVLFLPVRSRLTSGALFFGLALALAAAVGADHWNRHLLRERIIDRSNESGSEPDRQSLPGLPWLSPERLDPVRLVVSLSCGQCQRILEELVANRLPGQAMAPILVSTEEGGTAVTRLALAAVLTKPEPERPASFARVLSLLLGDASILARDDAETAHFLLSMDFPELDSKLAEVDAVLVGHQAVLDRLGIVGTPALVVKGRPVPFDRAQVAETP